MLGDNIIGASIASPVRRYHSNGATGAQILLKEVPDPQRFGVAEIDGGQLVSIEEKPRVPKSRLTVTGIYMYDYTVFEKCSRLVPSRRGELEITDVNNAYIREGAMRYSILEGWWTDAGTFSSLLRATNLVAEAAMNSNVPALVGAE
jgi:glucose-1-phosphate thymidylyltransferase